MKSNNIEKRARRRRVEDKISYEENCTVLIVTVSLFAIFTSVIVGMHLPA